MRRFRIPYFSCRGNVSDSEMYIAAKRLVGHALNEETPQIPLVLHLGDHDPSGLDMTRDIDWRLGAWSTREFMRAKKRGTDASIEVRRLALDINQCATLPPNTAKESDGRYAKYAKLYGNQSWELDAMDPTELADLIRDEIVSLLDTTAWNDALAREEANRDKLRNMAMVS